MKKIIIILFFIGLIISCSRKVDEADSGVQISDFHQTQDPIASSRHDIFIPRNGSLFAEMTKLGLTPIQIIELTLVFGDNVDFRAVMPDDHFQVLIDRETNNILEFSYLPDIITTHRIVRNNETGDYEYFLDEKEIQSRKIIVDGVVYTTFIDAMAENNIESIVRHAVANAMSSRINFTAHARVGDTFRVMYEERLFEGTRVPGSRLFYMSYNGRATGFHEGFRYQEEDEKSVYNGFYTEQGIAMLNADFRHPLDRIHVTSPYGMRFHPITRRWAMHNGVDYRGATGTPVYAVSSGRVIMARWNGGYGNSVEIQHANNHITQYAHLHRINVRQGQNVNRGTVIGTVGSTGVSTGPHLHFGLRIGGRWVNPSQIRMVSAVRLEGNRLAEFQNQILEIRDTVQRIENEAISPFEMTIFERYRRANQIRL